MCVVLTCNIFSDQVDALEGAFGVLWFTILYPEIKCKLALGISRVVYYSHVDKIWKVHLNLINFC